MTELVATRKIGSIHSELSADWGLFHCIQLDGKSIFEMSSLEMYFDILKCLFSGQIKDLTDSIKSMVRPRSVLSS